MPVYVFENCNSGNRKKCLSSKIQFHLYRFPKDLNLRSMWLQQIEYGQSVDINSINLKTAIVCSLHIAPYHIYKPMIQQLLNYSPKRMRKLKDDAIPLSIYGIDYNDVPFIRVASPSTPVTIVDPPKIITPSGIFTRTLCKTPKCFKKLKFDDITDLGVQPLNNIDEYDNDLIQK